MFGMDDITHSGGMCDPEAFHKAVDGMAKEVQDDMKGLSIEDARDSVLTMILMLTRPVGEA